MGLHRTRKPRKYVPLDSIDLPKHVTQAVFARATPPRVQHDSCGPPVVCEGSSLRTREPTTEAAASVSPEPGRPKTRMLSSTSTTPSESAAQSRSASPAPNGKQRDPSVDADDTPRLACDLTDFKDFWGDGNGSCRQDNDEFRLQTPRKEFRKTKILDPTNSRASLEIFKVASPPPSPRIVSEEKSRSNIPHWPFGSFGCIAPTTLELRGLPRHLTAEMLIEQLDAWGFRGFYNLVGVPCKHVPGGATILNAVRHAEACSLAKRLNGFSQWKGCDKVHQMKRKVCRASWCFTFQGLEALFQKYRHSQEASSFVGYGSYAGPLVLIAGGWVPLPFAKPMYCPLSREVDVSLAH